MSITELAIHNVLRTYSRQDRLGKLQRPGTASAARTSDKLDLSSKSQKLAALGRVADEFVSQRFPEISGDRRADLVRRQTDNLIMSHLGEIENQALNPSEFEDGLKAAYLKK